VTKPRFLLSGDVWEQAEEAGSLHSHRKVSLIARAGARAAARLDTSVRSEELLKSLNVLVVDVLDLIVFEIIFLIHVL
jgi:hypothetical protein